MGKVLCFAGLVCFDVVSLPANSNFLALIYQNNDSHNNPWRHLKI